VVYFVVKWGFFASGEMSVFLLLIGMWFASVELMRFAGRRWLLCDGFCA